MPAGPGAGVLRPGHAERLRGLVHQWQHAVHGLLRAHLPRPGPGSQAPILALLGRGGKGRARDQTHPRRHYRPARHVLSLRASALDPPPQPAHGRKHREFPAMNTATEAPRTEAARRHFSIEPIPRLEGDGRIEIFLDEAGDVEHAYLQIPELRSFEVFSRGRPAEDMPQITSRICGVCPTAHHMAATKALDDLYHVEPTPAGRKIRELVYNTFTLEDHALHFFVLGGPDFIVGPEA